MSCPVEALGDMRSPNEGKEKEQEKEKEGGYSARNQGAALVVEIGTMVVFGARCVLVEAVVAVRKN